MSTVTIIPCRDGRLRSAYPASRHDVELRVEGVALTDLSTILAAASDRTFDSDASCRRVVFAAQAGDLARIAAAESAGFHYVVDVDIDDAGELVEVSLLVREPHFVTHLNENSDGLPQL